MPVESKSDMPENIPTHAEMVRDVMDAVLTKLPNIPAADRSLVVIASLEAIASIAAEEATFHCKEKGKDRTGAIDRIDKYASLFVANADRALPETFEPLTYS